MCVCMWLKFGDARVRACVFVGTRDCLLGFAYCPQCVCVMSLSVSSRRRQFLALHRLLCHRFLLGGGHRDAQMLQRFFDLPDEAFLVVDGVPVSLRFGVDFDRPVFEGFDRDVDFQVSRGLSVSVELEVKKPGCFPVDQVLDLVGDGLVASAAAVADQHHQSGVCVGHDGFNVRVPHLKMIKSQ